MHRFAVILAFIASLGCAHSSHKLATKAAFHSDRLPAQSAGTWVSALPGEEMSDDVIKEMLAMWEKKRGAVERKVPKPSTASAEQMQVIGRYIDYLKLDTEEQWNEVMDRLFESSTQFLFCSDLESWECLEKSPQLTPMARYRRESGPGLGSPVKVNENFAMDYYFTKQWYKFKKELTEGKEVPVPAKAELAGVLAGVIGSQKWDRVSMAIYGMDGLGEKDLQAKGQPENHSMDAVFSAITKLPNARAVVDTEDYNPDAETGSKAKFQYPPTEKLCEALNKGTTEQTSRVRLEYPNPKIMHNKFFVFEKGAVKSVWTGTANISKNCTGDEDFANMAVHIKSTDIAKAYLTEFEEMFTLDPQVKAPFVAGHFHQNKIANTQRYFVFKDGTEARVHFSPTDDGEHRAILPMLLSAQKGDEIRISMFGSSGIEYIRAMQLAAARGAIVKLFLDRDTGNQVVNSWANNKGDTPVQGPNPYGKVAGKLEARYNNWGQGHMNHHKTATLTRKIGKSTYQVLIVGSQNWSGAGNDENDENMVSIRHKTKGLAAATAFNTYFDQMLWPTGKTIEYKTHEQLAQEEKDKAGKK